MLSQNTCDMYGANKAIIAGENNYGFVKLRQLIPEIASGIRYFDLRHGNIQIQLVTNPETECYASIDVNVDGQHAQGTSPYTINDLCLFRKLYKFNPMVSPKDSMM